MNNNHYDDILQRAEKELSREELLKLSEELSVRAGRKHHGKSPSIPDLRGLGKEIWKDIDPDDYVAKERDSWDG